MKIFICGPTLYEKSHLGHARIFIFFNFLINYHKYKGNLPIAIVQLTDIDPKIYSKRTETNTELDVIIIKNFTRLVRDLTKLQVISNFLFTRVSDFQIQMKKRIINVLDTKNGYSYAGNIYLKMDSNIKSPFGLRSEELDDMPIDISPGKEDQKDIMIWNSENFYENTDKNSHTSDFHFRNLVSGIPGWHYQDYQVISSVFNNDYDIHGGAIELAYPHHEFIYRISQQMEGQTKVGKKSLKWIHLGILKINSEKMSNSSNNTISISQILKKYSSNTIKIFFLSYNYRDDINFLFSSLKRAVRIDNEISSFLISNMAGTKCEDESSNDNNNLRFREFFGILENDYDTRSAIKYILKSIRNRDDAYLIKKMIDLLGLRYY